MSNDKARKGPDCANRIVRPGHVRRHTGRGRAWRQPHGYLIRGRVRRGKFLGGCFEQIAPEK
jgi:hypothetical protein